MAISMFWGRYLVKNGHLYDLGAGIFIAPRRKVAHLLGICVVVDLIAILWGVGTYISSNNCEKWPGGTLVLCHCGSCTCLLRFLAYSPYFWAEPPGEGGCLGGLMIRDFSFLAASLVP